MMVGVKRAKELQAWAETRFDRDSIQKELKSPKTLYFFGIGEGVPVGLSKFTLPNGDDERWGTLSALYVDRAWHGKGLGQALLEAVLLEARSMNLKAIDLDVWTKNAQVKRFYEKNGFFPFEHRSIKIEARGFQKVIPHWRMVLFMKDHD